MENLGEDAKESSSYEFEEGTLYFFEDKESLADGDSLQYSGDDLSSDRSRRSKGSTSALDGASSFIYPPVAALHRYEGITSSTGVNPSSIRRNDPPLLFPDLSQGDTAMNPDHCADNLPSFSLKMSPARVTTSSPAWPKKPPPPPCQNIIHPREASTLPYGRTQDPLCPRDHEVLFGSSQQVGASCTENESTLIRVVAAGPFPEAARLVAPMRPSVASEAPPHSLSERATSARSYTKPSYNSKNATLYNDALLALSAETLERSWHLNGNSIAEDAHTLRSRNPKSLPYSDTTEVFKMTCFRPDSMESIVTVDTASDIVSDASQATPRCTTKKLPSAQRDGLDANQGLSVTSEERQHVAVLGQDKPKFLVRLERPSKSYSIGPSAPAIPFRRPAATETSLVLRTSTHGETDSSINLDGDASEANTVQSSACSVVSFNSGVDLDEKTRNNIIAKSTSMYVARRLSRLQIQSAGAFPDDHSAASNTRGLDEDKKSRNSFVSASSSMLGTTDFPSSELESRQEKEIEDDDKSVESNTSGVELDEATRDKIVARSTSMYVARRRSSAEEDTKAPASKGTIRLGSAATKTPVAAASTERKSKRHSRRISSSSDGSSNRSSFRNRQAMDKKGAFLPRSVGHTDGASATSRGSSSKREMLEREKLNEDCDGLPFLPVATSRGAADEDVEDIEAHAGVPVVLPGAFAIRPRSADDILQDSNSGFDSDIDENTVVVDNPVRSEEIANSNVEPVVPDTPVEAELYEEAAVADAEIIYPSPSDFPKKSWKRYRYFAICLVLLPLAIAGGVVLLFFRPSKETNSPCEKNCEGVEIEGWIQLGGVMAGPLDNESMRYGSKVAMSGDGSRVAIGLPGREAEDDAGFSSPFGGVSIMKYNGTSWDLVHELHGIQADGKAGSSVAISNDGTRVAVGAPGKGKGGYTAIYHERDTGDWDLLGEVLQGVDFPGANSFGSTIALSASGDTLAVGDIRATIGDDLADVGIVRVFRYNGTVWMQLGNDIQGSVAGELFGWSLDLSDNGKRVACSAVGTDGSKGEVSVFDIVDGRWEQVGSPLVGETSGERFGFSISLGGDGNSIAVGAPGHSEKKGYEMRDAGRVRSFAFDAESVDWKIAGQPIDGDHQSDQLGSAVAMSSDGSTMVIGSPHSSAFGTSAGMIKIMKLEGGDWVQMGSILGRENGDGGLFGSSVDISTDGMTVVGGAPDFSYDGKLSKVGLAWAYQRDLAAT